MTKPPDPSIDEIEADESLAFPAMSNDMAVDLGGVAVATIRELGLDLAVEIQLRGDVVFRAKLGSTGPGNDPWLQRKAAAALQFGSSSLLARLRVKEGTLSPDDMDTEALEGMALHGGSLPLRVDGDLVGTITMSGEPDVIDHQTVVTAVRRYLAR
jgi:uncharacterized protein (UPF0303 family)